MQPPVTLSVGGLVIRVYLPDEACRLQVRQRYVAFLSESPAGWEVRVQVRDGPVDWSVRHSDTTIHFEAGSHGGTIDLATRTCTVAIRAGPSFLPALDRVLAYLCMQALPGERGALVLHAAGLASTGRGYAFFGRSGAGKTTLLSLAPAAFERLGDECVVVGQAEDRILLLSTPFWGHSTPASLIDRQRLLAPLAGLFELVHGAENCLVRLAPAEAAAALLRSEKVSAERVQSASAWLRVAADLIARVPVYRFEFRPDPSAWHFLAERGTEFVSSASHA